MNTARTYSIPNFNFREHIHSRQSIRTQTQNQTHAQAQHLFNQPPSTYHISTLPPTPSSSSLSSSSSTGITVVCRFRPVNDLEKEYNSKIVAKIVSEKQVDIHSDSEFYIPSFQFDRIFPMTSTQSDIYSASSQSIIQSVLDGYNGTILAYGQTASGKTHTMQGLINNAELKGIIPRAISQIFSYVNSKLKSNEDTISISLTMIEIYMERVNDLLNLSKQNLTIRESKDKKHYIDDVSEYIIKRESDFLDLFNQGIVNRTNGSTQMNYNSSRSHCIVIITITQKNLRSRITKRGKLYLVDLAGSEKASKTGVTGLNLEEAKNINKSLSTLGLIIKTLTDGTSTHIPYRESKLTRILSESLGGNSKTCLILTCSPTSFNEAETLSTLRFGMRAKKIKNKPIVNKELSLIELKEKLDELTMLINDKNNRIKQLELKIRSSGINTYESSIEDNQNEIELNDCLKDITIVDRDNEKVVNDLNQKLKEKEEEHQMEIKQLLETISVLNQSLSQKKAMKEYSFQNLKIKNVFHTVYNNSEESNLITVNNKEDKGINTDNKENTLLAISNCNSFSIVNKKPIVDKQPDNSNAYSHYFILICIGILLSYIINIILEYC